jgi:vanillate O-demethylase monooxygenase subunit
MIEVGVALQGHGGYDAPNDKKAYSVVVDFITPETETSIHYFWGMARKFNPTDKALTASIREGRERSSAKTCRCWSCSRRTCWRTRSVLC